MLLHALVLLVVSQLPKITTSDHNMILATPTLITSMPSQTRKVKVRCFRNSAWRTFGRWLTTKDWSQVLEFTSCPEIFHTFITEIQNAVDTFLPFKSICIYPTDRSWNTKTIKMLIKKRQTTVMEKILLTIKVLRNRVQIEIKLAMYRYYNHRVADLEKMDVKKWWRQIKSLTGQDPTWMVSLVFRWRLYRFKVLSQQEE